MAEPQPFDSLKQHEMETLLRDWLSLGVDIQTFADNPRIMLNATLRLTKLVPRTQKMLGIKPNQEAEEGK